MVRISRRIWKQVRLDTHYEHTYPNAMNNGKEVVRGEGDVNSPIVIIGEAPGEEEERLGRPFVGASGNLLKKWIRWEEIRHAEPFFTNLLKHRPPNNADPTEEEAQKARVLMKWELAILRPRIVVTLGKFATEVFYPNPTMRVLSGTARVKRLAGEPEFEAIVIPIYHPSAALRVSSVRDRAQKDFHQVRRQLDQLADNPLLER